MRPNNNLCCVHKRNLYWVALPWATRICCTWTLPAGIDWPSALTFTDDLSFLYYSVGATAVLNEMAHLPEVVDLAKVRVSYAQVGNSEGLLQP